jgi:putative transposase
LAWPSHTLQGILSTVYTAWQRCFKKLAKRPKLKGQRNKLTNIPFPDPFRTPYGNRISIPGLGRIRFHTQDIPTGKIKCGRLIKRASGWYLCLVIDAEPNPIPHVADGHIGIDPGFKHLLSLSTGEKIPHPRELEDTAERLAQAQRGHRHKLTARLQERLANQRKDRNHKLSRRLVCENKTIVFSADNHKAIAKSFGKSVASSAHAQLRAMLAYKCTHSSRRYLEVPSKHSTKTCSACGSLSGPAGYTGLSIRHWVCAVCGTAHDRDINAAVNTLYAGLGISLERTREGALGIPWL